MQLYFYDNNFEKAVQQYTLTEEQLRFTVIPEEGISLAKEDSERFPILAMDGDTVVTFFVLHKGDGITPYSTNKHAILLRTFSTDARYRRNGYAKKVLTQLPAFLRENFREIDEIVLAVNIKNNVAQCLYKKCGYIDEGKRTMGRKGKLIIMSYYL